VPVKNRIVGYGLKPIDDIQFHDANWRVHPWTQRQALSADLRKIGMVQSVIENVTTGNLLDGHLRVLIYDEEGETHIPVTQVELSREEELEVLAHFDPLGDLAVKDSQKLEELLDQIPPPDDPAIQEMMRSLDQQHGIEGPGFMPSDESSQVRLDQDHHTRGTVSCPECGHTFSPERPRR
jgi:hypothetical protein